MPTTYPLTTLSSRISERAETPYIGNPRPLITKPSICRKKRSRRTAMPFRIVVTRQPCTCLRYPRRYLFTIEMLLQVLVAVFVLFASRFLWRRWKYDLHKVPSPPGNLFFGHTLDLIFGNKFGQQVLYIRDKFKRLGNPRMIRLDIMGKQTLHITDQSFIKNVILSKTDPFYRLQTYVLSPLLGNDATAKFLFTPPDISPYSKAIRKIYATAMQSQNLSRLTPKILEKFETVMESIDRSRKDGPVEIKDPLTRLTLDVIGYMALGVNLGGLDRSKDIHGQLRKVKTITVENFTNPFMMMYCRLLPWSNAARRRKAEIDALLREYNALIEGIMKRDSPPEGEEPMWYMLKTMKDPETGKPLEFKTLLAEFALIIFAGMDSTAQQLSWILMLLSAHPNVVEKLLEELEKHGLYGPEAREITFDDLGDLSYLTAIIKEGMRVAYTVAALPPRYVPRDMDILGYRIPKGTAIVCPGMRAYSLEEEWGDPDVFRPERWLTGEDMSNKYNIGFSYGPRDCIGQKLAMLEMRLGIVKLMRSYEFKLIGEWRDVLDGAKDGVVIEAKNGIWFDISPRTTD